jgi:hypothetical protein
MNLLSRALARCWPRRRFWLGRPMWATIARGTSGEYLLRIGYTQGVDWVDLPAAVSTGVPGEGSRPDARQLAAVAAALSDRRLTRTTEWQLDADGNLCAPLTVTPWRPTTDRKEVS